MQEAAAAALAAVSGLVDCSALVQRLINDYESGSPLMQQSLARVLGVLNYARFRHGIVDAVKCLLRMVDRKVGCPHSHLTRHVPDSEPGGKSGTGSTNIEARRNAFSSMPQIVENVADNITECEEVDASAVQPPLTVF